MSDAKEMDYIVVVGLNRPRLAKIMSLVQQAQSESSSEALNSRTEFVPCLAAMKAYKDGGGNEARYMASFICHDGSPMTKFLDDESFRASLKTVLMVGYEWKDGDKEHMTKYFDTNNLQAPVECIHPNPDFDHLQGEMDFFKSLNQEEKEKHLSEQTMGPGKMAGFVIQAINSLKPNLEEEINTKVEDEIDGIVGQTEVDHHEKIPIKKELIMNPNLPRYACRMCRTILFGQDHLAPNHVQNLHSFKRANYDANRPTVACQSIFCSEEVLESLSANGEDIEGRLACPKCNFKIGNWRWSGAQVRVKDLIFL
jgi:hypothetical protein